MKGISVPFQTHQLHHHGVGIAMRQRFEALQPQAVLASLCTYGVCWRVRGF